MTTRRTYQFLQLDVFTDQAFAGNPLAVYPDGRNLSDQEMQQIAREMNLSETVFVLPSEKPEALRRLRIFTPLHELPFAGHPVVGTWYALASLGIVEPPPDGNGSVRIQHELGIGVLPVEIEFKERQPVRVTMTQGRFELGAAIVDETLIKAIAEGFGLTSADLHPTLPVQTMSTGVPFLAVPLRSMEALARTTISNSGLSETIKKAGVLSCYLFTLETKDGGAAQAHARMFAPDSGIGEDPATGSAGGPLGGYLVYHHALSVAPQDGIYRFVIEQGDFTNRPSRLSLEVKGAPQKSIDEVKVGGPSVIVARGELTF
jgi:trans-2,3-dihydro-3-hydroxyanthranilate isomerase